MCGIYALISEDSGSHDKRQHVLRMLALMKHRGPDEMGYFQAPNVYMGHCRLSIIDPSGGNQPLRDSTNNFILTVNGEIFNYQELKELPEYASYPYKTKSDCEVILAMYKTLIGTKQRLTHGEIVDMLGSLDGQYSFILHDIASGMVLVARDPFGITQCYFGIDIANWNIEIASEQKALVNCGSCVAQIPAGSYMYFSVKDPKPQPINFFSETKYGGWMLKSDDDASCPFQYIPNSPTLTCADEEALCQQIRFTLEGEVAKRLMSDVPFGCLLSGGLDSSLISAITMKLMRDRGDTTPLHTFSIGDVNSTDLPYARKVADYIRSIHHEVSFTVEEGLSALKEVIWHLETADITTIRASTPHFLLARAIHKCGIKMVLSGEGSDEILGGYLYFHYAPNDIEHQMECKRRVSELGFFDCLRSDKSTMGNSVEARVPFLGEEFVDLCININKDVKTQKGIEKYILRKAFDIKDDDGHNVYLPDEVLYRQKEQFSDGISGSKDTWIERLKAMTTEEVMTNHKFAYENRDVLFPVNTPETPEAFYYMMIFESLFPKREGTFKKWIPKTSWTGVASSDPSGRAQACHVNSYVDAGATVGATTN